MNGLEIEAVKSTQREWAARLGYAVDDSEDRFADPSHALRKGILRPETRSELERGDGNEIPRLGHLRSSACLAVNVFEPWRDSPESLGEALAPGTGATALAFEVKQPTGLQGVPPNLDVLLTGAGRAIGIECKFVEMYSEAKNTFAESYFADPQLWGDLVGCRSLALAIADGREQFRLLAAAQLLKHALGLSKNQRGGFTLQLIWYRVDGPAADQIDDEIERFASLVDEQVGFGALTYQQLVERLRVFEEPDPGYFEYLATRYGL